MKKILLSVTAVIALGVSASADIYKDYQFIDKGLKKTVENESRIKHLEVQVKGLSSELVKTNNALEIYTKIQKANEQKANEKIQLNSSKIKEQEKQGQKRDKKIDELQKRLDSSIAKIDKHINLLDARIAKVVAIMEARKKAQAESFQFKEKFAEIKAEDEAKKAEEKLRKQKKKANKAKKKDEKVDVKTTVNKVESKKNDSINGKEKKDEKAS